MSEIGKALQMAAAYAFTAYLIWVCVTGGRW